MCNLSKSILLNTVGNRQIHSMLKIPMVKMCTECYRILEDYGCNSKSNKKTAKYQKKSNIEYKTQ